MDDIQKVKKILDIDNIDLCNPIEEPNLVDLNGSSGHPKPSPNSFLGAKWFGTKTMPCQAIRRRSCSLG